MLGFTAAAGRRSLREKDKKQQQSEVTDGAGEVLLPPGGEWREGAGEVLPPPSGKREGEAAQAAEKAAQAARETGRGGFIKIRGIRTVKSTIPGVGN